MRQPPAHRFDRTIVDGPLASAVWKLAWPTMLQNGIAGLQGIVDHTLVGHFVGYEANAAIGVSWQILLVLITFMSALFTGTAVLVARFAGAGDADRVNRVVYQAFLTSLLLWALFLAPVGYILSPALLSIVHAEPAVVREALPFLRTMFLGNLGLLLFFMLGGAFRAAGDARTPLRLGILLTILNIVANVVLIRGLGPVPAFGTQGAALGTTIASTLVAAYGLSLFTRGRSVIRWSRSMPRRFDWPIVKALFSFGLPAGFQGIAMNVAGVMLLRFIGSLQHSAEAQAAYAVGYGELFALITWTSVGLMGATATVVGQNLGAGKPERSLLGPRLASRIGVTLALAVGLMFLAVPRILFAFFGLTEPTVVTIGSQLLRYLTVSGLFVTVALTYTGALQGSGDTRSPFVISVISQIVVPLGLCALIQAMRPLEPSDIWRAIVLGHVTRATLSVLRFNQGRWRSIAIPIEASPEVRD